MSNATTQDFNMEDIINTIKTGTLCLLGKGSSRKCYDIGNGYVAKVAFTDAGVNQNYAEIELSEEDSLFNPVLQHSSDFKVVIMAKAQPTTLSQVWKALKISKDEVYEWAKDFANTYQLACGDITRKSSWGIVDGKPVMIDYGCTMTVFETFYKGKMVYTASGYRYMKPRVTKVTL